MLSGCLGRGLCKLHCLPIRHRMQSAYIQPCSYAKKRKLQLSSIYTQGLGELNPAISETKSHNDRIYTFLWAYGLPLLLCEGLARTSSVFSHLR